MAYAQQPNAPGYWSYDGLPIQADVETHQTTVELCKRVVPGKGAILDLAAGHGALSKSLLDNGFDVTCTSWNGNVRLPVSTYRIDLDKHFDGADLGGRSFDLACAIEIIEHVENPAQLLRSLAQVVKPGGHIVVSTPNVESAQARIEWLLNGYPYMFSDKEIYENRHISLLWRQGIESMIQMAGFDIVDRRFVGSYRFSSALQRAVRQPLYWLLERFGRGDTRGTSRLYLARRSERAPKVLGSEEVA